MIRAKFLPPCHEKIFSAAGLIAPIVGATFLPMLQRNRQLAISNALCDASIICTSNIRVLGVPADGGMTEFLVVPEHPLYPANNLTFAQATMVEFFHRGSWRAVR